MLGKFGIFAWASERANGLARPIGGAIDFRGIILEDLLWSPALPLAHPLFLASPVPPLLRRGPRCAWRRPFAVCGENTV